MIENNLNNNINKLSIIPKEEDTFESINIIKESNNYNILTRELNNNQRTINNAYSIALSI